jgi:hypothetical protein|tara:strand:- start:787 stop:945 length:159 start_codon:yes stop_codon:yes gene_type:complete
MNQWPIGVFIITNLIGISVAAINNESKWKGFFAGNALGISVIIIIKILTWIM